jgi:crotonobetainyl-CoA:carnitine CoA-transferase CaiB-like acyl-CoA transferase
MKKSLPMAKTKDAIAGEPRAADDEIVRGNVNRRVERAPTFVSVYSNDVQFQTNPWDIRLEFGVMRVDSEGGVPVANVLEVAEVRLSPQLAKRVAAILAQQIDAYEARFGLLPQPPD